MPAGEVSWDMRDFMECDKYSVLSCHSEELKEKKAHFKKKE
jgi:hypothetical protein